MPVDFRDLCSSVCFLLSAHGMGRKKVVCDSRAAYHVTARSNNKEWFYLPTKDIWKICSETLSSISELYGVEIHSFVLMSNHFHLILSAPSGAISPSIRYLMTETSKRANFKAHRTNHLFGNRYKWSVLHCPVSYAYVYKYVLRNPVRSSLSKRVEEYPFSSLSGLLSGSLDFPLIEGFVGLWTFVPKAIEARLTWLNLPTQKEEHLIRMGLRRAEFQIPRGNTYRHEAKRLRFGYGVERS